MVVETINHVSTSCYCLLQTTLVIVHVMDQLCVLLYNSDVDILVTLMEAAGASFLHFTRFIESLLSCHMSYVVICTHRHRHTDYATPSVSVRRIRLIVISTVSMRVSHFVYSVLTIYSPYQKCPFCHEIQALL